MSTRTELIDAALDVLENSGEIGFSTRAVCTAAGVTAPTLYHHFGSADGLLDAVFGVAFEQFISRKRIAQKSADPLVALRSGWDSYMGFVAERPRLYSAMLVRVLQGANISAIDTVRSLLVQRVQTLADQGRLVMDVEDAADVLWASAHGAASLFVMAGQRQPTPLTIDTLRKSAVDSICNPSKRKN